VKNFKAKDAFENGRHQDVVANVQSPGKTGVETMALICSYCFLGRLDEAKHLWNLKSLSLNEAERSRARFALAVAHTRISKFKGARFWLKESLANEESASLPDVYQGLAVYHYYLGNFEKAALNAQKALSLALKLGDRYMHAFAVDLYGHALVQTGKRAAGLQKLSQAQELAKRSDSSSPFTTAKLLYEAEAGLRPASIVSELEKLISNSSAEDSYTRANLTLELARQLTLRGQWQEARNLLDGVSAVIYGFQNRRQEALLQLRLAELSYRQGDAASALHFTQAARRCLNRIADRAYEVRVLGLEIKIESKLLGKSALPEALSRLKELSLANPRSISGRIYARTAGSKKVSFPPGEDALGDVLDSISEAGPSVLLKSGYIGLWPEFASIHPGSSALVILENGQWLSIRREGVALSEKLSKRNFLLLKALSEGIAGKDALARKVWGYEYEARHDSMIYTALATLRKALGPVGYWVETHDEGWSLGDRGTPVHFVNNSGETVNEKSSRSVLTTEVSALSHDPSLNWRQIKALGRKSSQSPWTVPDYKEAFDVSTMTAWRDLDGLAKVGYLQRIGRGRATVYLPLTPSETPSVSFAKEKS
jgi:tetratricopeptide (TPR) repeat protein